MEYRRFENQLIVRLEKGDEIVSSLNELCILEDIQLGSISGLGAVGDISLGIYITKEKEYISKQFQGDYEILTLTGNITRQGDAPYIHCHLTLGNVDTNELYGGHLNNAIVSATVEMIVSIIQGHVNREFSDEIGLNLLKF